MSEKDIQTVIAKLKDANFCMIAFESETETGVFFNTNSSVIQNGLSAIVERTLYERFGEQERALRKNKMMKAKA